MRKRTPRVRVRVSRHRGLKDKSSELRVIKVRGRGVYNNKNDMGLLMFRTLSEGRYADVWVVDAPVPMKLNIEHVLGLLMEQEHLTVLEAYV